MHAKTSSVLQAAALAMLAVTFALVISASATVPGERVLHRFIGTKSQGGWVYAGLVADRAGALYGVTQAGGPAGFGTVFKLTPPSKQHPHWLYTTLYSFTGGNDGGNPMAALTFDKQGNLYGSTTFGGTSRNWGTIFRLSPASDGVWNETVLFNLGYLQYTAFPLVFDRNGALYGTNLEAGQYDYGSVFRLSPPRGPGGMWTYSILHSFAKGSDGVFPEGGVVLDKNGVLYGTTMGGGASNDGAVYALSPPATKGDAWTETILHSFTQNDGLESFGGLVLDNAGNLYGTANQGGANFDGTVFELTPGASGWTFSVLYNFQGGNDGNGPLAGVTLDQHGNLFGTTSMGGGTAWCIQQGAGCGTVFELSPSAGGWTESVLHSFQATNDGSEPNAGVIVRGNAIYGTTLLGGQGQSCKGGGGTTGGCGTVFRVSPVQ
jgi:uncharacterized repeat protein (TIGR03803 family)